MMGMMPQGAMCGPRGPNGSTWAHDGHAWHGWHARYEPPNDEYDGKGRPRHDAMWQRRSWHDGHAWHVGPYGCHGAHGHDEGVGADDANGRCKTRRPTWLGPATAAATAAAASGSAAGGTGTGAGRTPERGCTGCCPTIRAETDDW